MCLKRQFQRKHLPMVKLKHTCSPPVDKSQAPMRTTLAFSALLPPIITLSGTSAVLTLDTDTSPSGDEASSGEHGGRPSRALRLCCCKSCCRCGRLSAGATAGGNGSEPRPRRGRGPAGKALEGPRPRLRLRSRIDAGSGSLARGAATPPNRPPPLPPAGDEVGGEALLSPIGGRTAGEARALSLRTRGASAFARRSANFCATRSARWASSRSASLRSRSKRSRSIRSFSGPPRRSASLSATRAALSCSCRSFCWRSLSSRSRLANCRSNSRSFRAFRVAAPAETASSMSTACGLPASKSSCALAPFSLATWSAALMFAFACE
mmetsp:Transcript_6925/g.19510  ORF Transcript_6925/g.19510 Transcript_6925/m.19510 type:complete len:323 (+) Transcript_6925:75-1043(+)